MKKAFHLFCITMLITHSLSNAVTKKVFDFVVGVTGDFKAAKTAAEASTSGRYYIFFPDSEYNIGTLTGDGNQMTTFSGPNVSFIGQSTDKTIIYNESAAEGISTTATLYLKNANNVYMQDVTIRNKGKAGSSANRHVVICEESNNVIYKNVKLLGTQDCYYTKGTKTYWENGEIHGTTDFICGKGDVFFNNCLLWADKTSACITAPDGSVGTWGYVFSNCTIDGSIDKFLLGRAWKQNAKCSFINTIMNKLPAEAGWTDPIKSSSGNATSFRLAEYNSKTSSGTIVDLSKRKSTFVNSDGVSIKSNPILSESEAVTYTIDAVCGSWKPNLLTVQLAAPVVTKDGSNLKWDDNTNALCWVVFKDGKYFKCVITPTCAMATGSGKYTVRAANEMGGLGVSSNIVSADGTPVKTGMATSGKSTFCININNNGVNLTTVAIPSNVKGSTLNIISKNGKVLHSRLLKNENENLNLGNLATGSYIFQITNKSDRSEQLSFTRTVALFQ